MLNLSYNVSSDLKKALEKTESLRLKILLAPVSPKNKLKLRWEAMTDRIWGSLGLDDINLTKREITAILTGKKKGKLSNQEADVIGYRNAMDYIYDEWLASPKTTTAETVLTLKDISCRGNLIAGIPDLKQFLDYIQASLEHPAIQAGIAQIQIKRIRPFSEGNIRTGMLLAQLFLYKGSFDLRRMVAVEEYLYHDREQMNKAIDVCLKSGNLTGWLEYYAGALISQMEKTIEKMKTSGATFSLPTAFWELTDRQKEILRFLENPQTSVTNKKAQKMFKISQITASRDLSRLATLGLLLAHGKGRAVYYTRV